MTSTNQTSTSSTEYKFQLTLEELSMLRDITRKTIEETPVTQIGGKYHKMYNSIYNKLCNAYITQPEITQLGIRQNTGAVHSSIN